MKTIIALVLVSLHWAAALAAVAPATPKVARDLATVQVDRLQRRSTDILDRSYHDRSDSYNVRINGLGEDVQLNLRSPSYSIFSPTFQYLEASTDPETQELRLDDSTPSQAELKLIEDNFFTDVASNAAVSLKRGATEDTPFTIDGRLDSMSIIHNEGLHELIRKETPKERINDYINLNRKLTPGKRARTMSSATPEVFVIFDYANSQVFANNRTRILDYLGVFFHAINNRYATATDPRISFRISGVTSITALTAQPYMENNKVSGGYDINKVLPDLSSWAYANNQKTPKYDLVALISGTDMQAKDSNGQYSSGVAGLAYVNAACWNYTQAQQYLGTSVTEDRGGYYDGTFSVAHELAHNMGAPHDGDGDAKNCPWSDGYIMSYEGWGTKNKFYFSPCSLSLMKALIDSAQGSCTKSQQSSEQIPVSNDNIGNRYTMGQLCVKYTNSSQAVPDPDTSAGDLCKNLKCRYPIPNKPGWYSIITLNHPPGDDSPCGSGGKCVDGDCVGSSG